MAEFVKQVDFSGGEISDRMVMRTDTDVLARSVAEMINFMPTLQGSAERSPGTRLVEVITLGNTNARIIPYFSPTNERSLVKIEPAGISFIPAVTERFYEDIQDPDGAPVITGTIPIRRQIVENSLFTDGSEPWSIIPTWYTSNHSDNASLGGRWRPGGADRLGVIVMTARVYKAASDSDTCVVTGTATVPKDTTAITLDYRVLYKSAIPLASDYDFTLKVGTTAGASDIALVDFQSVTTGQVGAVAEATDDYTANVLEDATLYFTISLTAKTSSAEKWSNPVFWLDRFQVWANDETEAGDGTIVGASPYAGSDLPDIHFIQSPLMPPVPGGVGKELVTTHPNQPPYRLFYNTVTVQYEYEAISFTNVPSTWSAGNYPATCGTYRSRLVLAGSQGKPVPGDPNSGDTETVWCTEVGLWDTFSGSADVNPDDSIEFVTTYRSPIQWVYGQKDLLIGALEMEYTASADGIFQPADLGVEMHSTHGSANVQPAAFGNAVLFPAEAGTKVRAMSKDQNTVGWLAPDLTLFVPELCASGIKRMVRMRNPHHMSIVLLNNGLLAVLHHDGYAGITGWSRMDLGGSIKDIAVLANDRGEDMLFLTIVRTVAGVKKLILEVIANWTESAENWDYMLSSRHYDFEVKQSFVTGLSHLEGERVQVLGNGNYAGTFVVTSGRVDFTDQLGDPISYIQVSVGLPMYARLKTLPLIGEDPSSKKRYSSLSVRVRSSIIPMIGAQSETELIDDMITERADTRPVTRNLDTVSQEWALRDVSVSNDGWSSGQQVTVEENLPLRVEVLSIFGKLGSHSA